MLNSILANEIVNALECGKNEIPWTQFRHCNAYTTICYEIYLTLNGKVYSVTPIKSYATIVGFVYNNVVYEIGKYSRTTSKQFTQICNAYFSDYDRVYMEKRYC